MKRVIIASTTLPKKYEVEVERRNITPREFFWYCKQRLAAKGVDISSWVEEYKEWANPEYPSEYRRVNHEFDDGTTQTEISKYQSYDFEMYLQDTYNFQMQFEFEDDKKGWGYMYAVEYEC